MTTIFIIVILLLGFLITFQIAKASEYVGVLKGEKKSFEQNNRINAFLLLIFMILGLIGVYWCHQIFKGRVLGDPASDHGEKIDFMLYITVIITGIVFVLTQVLLFWFAFRFQYSEKRKPLYFPHNNKLEVLWTVVPAIFLTVLVGFGLFYWFKITGDAPKDALVVEITGKQFNWIYRYPGKDGVFGRKYYKNISDSRDNYLGLIWEDVPTLNLKADKAAKDDIVNTQKMLIVVGRPVKLIINARDVVHDVGLVHFRMKMDAVPGTPTTMWFTPKYTTKEMRIRSKKADFTYEISCDQMCGSGHFSMRGVIEVVTQAEFDAWIMTQKPTYQTAVLDKKTPTPSPGPTGPITPANSDTVTTGKTAIEAKPIAKN